MTAPMMSIADVATIVGLSEYTIRQAIRDGELPAIKIRGRIRIRPDDFAAWLDHAEPAGHPAPATSSPADAPAPPPAPRTVRAGEATDRIRRARERHAA